MLDKQTRGAILRLSSQGHGARSISRLLSVSRGAAKNVLRSDSDEVPQISRPKKPDQYREKIVQLLSDCDGNLLKVYGVIRTEGATFSYPTLTRFCRMNRLLDTKSNVTRSIGAAQEWLT